MSDQYQVTQTFKTHLYSISTQCNFITCVYDKDNTDAEFQECCEINTNMVVDSMIHFIAVTMFFIAVLVLGLMFFHIIDLGFTILKYKYIGQNKREKTKETDENDSNDELEKHLLI